MIMSVCCSIFDTTETCKGQTFSDVFYPFIQGRPIRNLSWAKGVYGKLRPGDEVIRLYYVDENSEKLNHENDIKCFSIRDLASYDWAEARLPHECMG